MAHIVVIDDNPDILKMVQKLLKATGHTVSTASDGERGLALIVRDRPDLVVLDLNLPKMDGHEICQRVKSDPQVSHIPVIMLTAAYTEVEDAKRGLSMGADEYVIKPFMHTPFMHTIQRLLAPKD